jgi:uncharacterized protein (DUF1684 family)
MSFAILAAPAATQQTDRAYREEIQKWRDDYETGLKRDEGWLTVAGLFWLKKGDNGFGTGLANEILLPEGSAPEFAGTFIFQDGKTRLLARPGAGVLLNGQPAPTEMPLTSDSPPGKPDRVTLGRLSMIVIKRGERFGIRLWDNASSSRRDFQGSRWFPIKASYRITAPFTSYPQPKMIAIANVLGDSEATPSPGYATFEIDGKQFRLEPVLEGNRLFFLFKDLTSGKQTYPAGRFLYADLPKDGKVVLDFNKAHNPPCAFTSYATCPLPPRQNYLAVAIEAGELKYDHASNTTHHSLHPGKHSATSHARVGRPS